MSRPNAPPVLAEFAKRTVLRSGYDVNSSESFATWDPSPSIRILLLRSRLDKIYSFGVRDTCYKVELTAMLHSVQSQPCWGLAVRHTEWAIHLAELERLQTGHQASWDDVLETFLPDDGCSSVKVEGGGLKLDDNPDADNLKPDDNLNIGGTKLDNDDPDTSKLKPGDNGKEAPVPPRQGIRTLTNILLQLSKVVSSVDSCGAIDN